VGKQTAYSKKSLGFLRHCSYGGQRAEFSREEQFAKKKKPKQIATKNV